MESCEDQWKQANFLIANPSESRIELPRFHQGSYFRHPSLAQQETFEVLLKGIPILVYKNQTKSASVLHFPFCVITHSLFTRFEENPQELSFAPTICRSHLKPFSSFLFLPIIGVQNKFWQDAFQRNSMDK